MPTNHFILKTLNIKDENIKMSNRCEERIIKGVVTKCYFGKLSYIPEGCIHCGERNTNGVIKKNATCLTKIIITKISERPAYLILEKQRFYCKNCDGYFTAKTNIVNEYSHISNQTRLSVLNKATQIRSQKSISESCSVARQQYLA